MELFIVVVLLFVSILINVSSIDDAFVDLLAFGIERFSFTGPAKGEKGEIPFTAVFVANWHEEDVLGRMVEGNLARIQIPAVKLYLGVYPNDTGTLNVAQELAAKHPDRVKVIVNTLPGPTSKGQMLNEMFRQVFSSENAPELVVLHDSEDIIDPRTFEVYTAYARDCDFIQVPVFSLNSLNRSMVAATYMDEFAERHTREMVVRHAVGATIPSAGVGTCMTKKLIAHFVKSRGYVLMTGCVTEDYILGVEAKRAGFKSAFAAISADEKRGLDFVATREFFPKSLSASIKQKTRWVYGINFEAMHKLGWQGDAWDVYFFFRDRKGIITNFLPPVSFVLLLLLASDAIDLGELPGGLGTVFEVSLTLNLAALVTRYLIRVASFHQVYGIYDWLGVALRWPVALYINMMAVWRAWKTYTGESAFATKPIVWSKTVHELPDDLTAVTR
ncbi:MAG: glycosyl transferase family protein [Rhodomicrobium sp.]